MNIKSKVPARLHDTFWNGTCQALAKNHNGFNFSSLQREVYDVLDRHFTLDPFRIIIVPVNDSR